MLVINEYGEFEVDLCLNWGSVIDYNVKKVKGEWPPLDIMIGMCNKDATGGTYCPKDDNAFVQTWID